MARVLINHGLNNRRVPDHWQRFLATALRADGHVVAYPQFPNPESPAANEWQDLLIAETELLAEVGEEKGELIFVGHSLGALNFLFAAQREVLPEKFDRVLLVAPADPELLPDLDFGALSLGKIDLGKSAGQVQIVASDADQWLPRGIKETFGEPLGLEPLVIAGAKHFARLDGWGHWQGVIDWVENPSADLTKR